MPTSQVNGIRVYWEINGDVGDPMVLVHGSWGDHQNWAAAVPALSRSFRVLTYDRRGHSRSERPAGQGSVRDDVADLAALLVELRHSPAHVVGHRPAPSRRAPRAVSQLDRSRAATVWIAE